MIHSPQTTDASPGATAGDAAIGRFSPLPHTQVTIDDAFWAPRQRVNRERTIPHIFEQCTRSGRINALRGVYDPEVVRGGTGGANIAVLFWDSDIAKWIEAASYSLATHPDAQVREADQERELGELLAVFDDLGVLGGGLEIAALGDGQELLGGCRGREPGQQ